MFYCGNLNDLEKKVFTENLKEWGIFLKRKEKKIFYLHIYSRRRRKFARNGSLSPLTAHVQ